MSQSIVADDSPLLEVIDGKRHAAAAVQRRGDVDGVESVRLPHVLHGAQEVAEHLAGQHLLHVHVLDVELGLEGQRELCQEERGRKISERNGKKVRGAETETERDKLEVKEIGGY